MVISYSHSESLAFRVEWRLKWIRKLPVSYTESVCIHASFQLECKYECIGSPKFEDDVYNVKRPVSIKIWLNVNLLYIYKQRRERACRSAKTVVIY